MPLPGHASADVEHRYCPPKDPAVEDQYQKPDDDLPTRAGEEPEHKQEGQPAEDQARGADVISLAAGRPHVADQPGADAADDPYDRGRPEKP